MTRARTAGLLLLLLGSFLFVLIGSSLARTGAVANIDFKTVYCGARALIEHRDPYNPAELDRIYIDQAAGHASDRAPIHLSVTRYIYPPTAFVLTVPFALLPWGPAHILWMLATAGTFILAAFLMWTVAAPRAPVAAGLLLALLLTTSELLIEVGNAAGIAVSLCVIAVWCFIQQRLLLVGVLCLAIALLVKPHDAGLVWLYFLLAGPATRKRALQTLLLVAILAVPLVLWTSSISPHWLAEMNSNLAAHSLPGADSDPGPSGVIPWTHGAQLISLQTVFSLFRDNPRFYNPASWILCAALLLVLAIAVLRSRPSPSRAWIALAAISALSMLPTYHRQQDTRLILLVIPAFALLWTERHPSNPVAPPFLNAEKRGTVAHLALLVTGATILLTGDTSSQLLGALAHHLAPSPTTLSSKLLTLLLARPAPLALLAVAIFYLYALHTSSHSSRRSARRPAETTQGVAH